MPVPELGRLRRIDDLRKFWEREDTDFTPWLAKPENIKLISEATDLDLEVVAEEKDVGPFRADILCRDTLSGHWVVVENQLEWTDHTHLGQIVTYAAGLDARAVVWISSRITPEHRAAIDWLNSIASAKVGFFALELELWAIEGYDKPAPHFTVVARPNDWQRAVAEAGEAAERSDLSDLRKSYVEYWTTFAALCMQRKTPFNMRKPGPYHNTDASIGRSGFTISPQLYPELKSICVSLTVRGDPQGTVFKAIMDQRSMIERDLGMTLEWDQKPGRAQNYITCAKDVTDVLDRSGWPSQQAWMADTMTAFHRVFQPIVRGLDIGDQ